MSGTYPGSSRQVTYDNALCESFFATLECELLDRVSLRTSRMRSGRRTGGSLEPQSAAVTLEE